MIPDLAYFLPLGVSGSRSHSLGGLFWFCLPAGVAAWAVYHVLVRPFVVAVAPTSVAARLGPGRPVAWSRRIVVRVVVSTIVAASTHILWDSFTHSTGAAVQAIAVLRHPVPLFPGYTPFVFTMLQHSSSIVGLSLVAIWGMRWFLRTQPSGQASAHTLHTPVRAALIIVWVVSSFIAGGLVLWARLSMGEAPFSVLKDNLGRAIFSSGTVFLTAFMASAVAWRTWATRLPRAVSRPDTRSNR
jgi:hypothetical protein